MIIFLTTVHLAVLFSIARWVGARAELSLRSFFWPALIAKLLAGFALGLLYKFYYTSGDTFTFFDLARDQSRLFHIDFRAYLDYLWTDAHEEYKGAGRSAFFVKTISLFSVVSAGNYWLVSIWFSFLSFLGCLYLAGTISKIIPRSTTAASLSLFFFPSVVFWGSGVIKESIALGSLMFVAGICLKLLTGRIPGWGEVLTGIVAFWMAINLKYYWVAVFVPVTASSLAVRYISARVAMRTAVKCVLWTGIFGMMALIASFSHPNFYLERFLEVVVENNHAFEAVSRPEDMIHFDSLEPTWSGVAASAPLALMAGLFRPMPWQAGNLIQLAASIENLVVLILVATGCLNLRNLFNGRFRMAGFSIIIYSGILCIFLALSTPNLGSLARYKIGFMPLLLFLVCYRNRLIDWAAFYLKRRPGRST